MNYTVTRAEIEAIDAALYRAIELGVLVRKDAYDVAAEIEQNAADDDYIGTGSVEIGSRNGRPWHVGLTQDHTEPDSPWVAYLEELGRGGYAETFPVEVDE